MTDATSPAIAQLEARLRATPDDEESWRVYGDHLLDRGDRHGELITLAALHAARPGDVQLAARLASLDAELREASQLDDERAHPTWRNGFPIALAYRIELPRDIRALGQLLADPRMRLVARLWLNFGDNLRARFFPELEQLALGHIRTLVVQRMRRGDALARALAAMPNLHLDTLRLTDLRLSDRGLAALARNASLRTLRELNLESNRFGSKGIEALLDAPIVENLEVLALHYNRIDVDTARALATSPRLAKLRTLGIYVHGMRDAEAIRLLASSSTLPRDITRYWQGILEQQTRTT